ncbi:MAG: undecaprenyl-diphosphate phosphatase [Actinobacteria bacterium]|nr:undecaprenyl-diphosphate phosphatase [Actinomycetota bacterium]
MIEVLQAIGFGILQGIAEFLPISSSGHLRIVQDLFGVTEQFGLAFDVFLHIATLLSVVVYFRKDLLHMGMSLFTRSEERKEDRHLLTLIVIATIPTGLIGLAGADWFEYVPTLYIGVAFLITSIMLAATDRFSGVPKSQSLRLGWLQAVVIGVAQGLAIMPGISRSGATIAAGLSMGLTREQAARFSFLLSVPVILLASAKQAYDVFALGETLPGPIALMAGFIASAVTGYLAIAGLMSFIKKYSFTVFSIYTAIIGISVIIWQMVA